MPVGERLAQDEHLGGRHASGRGEVGQLPAQVERLLHLGRPGGDSRKEAAEAGKADERAHKQVLEARDRAVHPPHPLKEGVRVELEVGADRAHVRKPAR
jgi:hypothetical protein